MSGGGYYDSGYQGGEETCGVCGRRTDEYGTCRCLALTPRLCPSCLRHPSACICDAPAVAKNVYTSPREPAEDFDDEEEG